MAKPKKKKIIKKSPAKKTRKKAVKKAEKKIQEIHSEILFDSKVGKTNALFVSAPEQNENLDSRFRGNDAGASLFDDLVSNDGVANEPNNSSDLSLQEVQQDDEVIPKIENNAKEPKKPFWKRWFGLNSIFFSIFIGLVVAGLFSAIFYAFATPPSSPYTPGQTLDPGCAAGSTNCTTNPPLTSISGLTADNSNELQGHNAAYFQASLGFTPYNSTNPSGYITSSSLSGYLTQTAGDLRYLGITSQAADSAKLNGQSASYYQPSNTILSSIASLSNAAGILTNNGSGTLSWGSVNLSGYVPTSTTVNGHALSGNVSVTASDVGLGSVQNTALSTWAGTTNLTTLGTITSGTWHGTAIGDSYISSASTWNAKQSALTFSNSLTNSSGTVTLTNDSATPGNSKYYGTNSSGTLGYFSLPSVSGYVPTSTTVNGHALSGNVSVTASDVGLGSVQNTALSTWAGTTNLTTLGTITSGTWHGTAIGDSYISSASTWNAKMTNPMTASGDIIYGGTSGAPTNLAKGTDGQVLTLVSGLPSWQTPSGGGGGNPGGSNTQLQFNQSGSFAANSNFQTSSDYTRLLLAGGSDLGTPLSIGNANSLTTTHLNMGTSDVQGTYNYDPADSPYNGQNVYKITVGTTYYLWYDSTDGYWVVSLTIGDQSSSANAFLAGVGVSPQQTYNSVSGSPYPGQFILAFNASAFTNNAIVSSGLPYDYYSSFIGYGLGLYENNPPATYLIPKAGEHYLYFKSDGNFYTMNDAGTEKEISVGGEAFNGFTNPAPAPDGNANESFGAGAGMNLGSTDIYNALFGYGAGNAIDGGSSNSAFGGQAMIKTTTGAYNVAMGASAMYNNTTGIGNVAMGYSALNGNTTGGYNVALGQDAMGSNTTGGNNIAIGNNAMASANTYSNGSVAIGGQALNEDSGSGGNVAIGYDSIASDNSGVGMVAVGANTLYSNTSGAYNTAIGTNALLYNTTGSSNTALGYFAGLNNVNGYYNSFIGYQAGYGSSNSGSSNDFFGYQAGYNISDGTYNNFFGNQAGYNISGGTYNNFFGGQAGYNISDGTYNNFFGNQAGYNIVGGNYNNFIGYQAGYDVGNGSNNIFIGQSAGYNISGSNNIFIGQNAGYQQTGNNTLIIDSVTSPRPNSIAEEQNALIYGVFDPLPQNQTFQVNAQSIYMPNLANGYGAPVDLYNGQLVVENSSLRYKHDVEPLADNWDLILQTQPKSFEYNTSNMPDVGYIAEDFDALGLKDLVNYDKQGRPDSINYSKISLYDTEVLKQQQTDINSLKLLAGLTSTGASGTGAVSGVSTQNSLITAASQLLQTVGITITNGVTNIADLAVNNLTVKTASVTGGIEMTDKATGQIYCTWIQSGQWQKAAGNCATVFADLPQISSTTSSSVGPETAVTPATDSQIAQTTQIVQQATQIVEQTVQQQNQPAQQAANQAQQAANQAQQSADQAQQAAQPAPAPALVPVAPIIPTTDDSTTEPAAPSSDQSGATSVTDTTSNSDAGALIQSAASSLLNGVVDMLKYFFSSSAKGLKPASLINATNSNSKFFENLWNYVKNKI